MSNEAQHPPSVSTTASTDPCLSWGARSRTHFASTTVPQRTTPLSRISRRMCFQRTARDISCCYALLEHVLAILDARHRLNVVDPALACFLVIAEVHDKFREVGHELARRLLELRVRRQGD